MTQHSEKSGPGTSPGTVEDAVTVNRGEQAMSAPVQDGAQELREEAVQARAEGVSDRADNVDAPGDAAERVEQTALLDEESARDEPTSG